MTSAFALLSTAIRSDLPLPPPPPIPSSPPPFPPTTPSTSRLRLYAIRGGVLERVVGALKGGVASSPLVERGCELLQLLVWHEESQASVAACGGLPAVAAVMRLHLEVTSVLCFLCVCACVSSLSLSLSLSLSVSLSPSLVRVCLSICCEFMCMKETWVVVGEGRVGQRERDRARQIDADICGSFSLPPSLPLSLYSGCAPALK
jgi:hypothetical protein